MSLVKFRYDINGLRAFSVIAVVLYHFKIPGFSSGFMGVDIFFAISGYLMTGIISKGISGDNFSVMGFYARRFNRLYPALAFMIVTVMVFGYFILTTVDYALLAKNSLSSAFFVSNIYYFFNSGYFDQSSLLNWLLHTWSLSVEWQFYLIYPLILLICSKIFKRILPAIIIMMAVSVYFSASMTFDNKDAGYFLLHTRAWEMLAGGVAFFINGYASHRFKYKKLASYLGWAIVLLSLAMIPESTMWPGYMAIIPVFGSCVILSVNADHKFAYRNAITKNIGLWSYSIYLWHWPIVVYLYSSGIIGEGSNVAIGIALSIAFGFLSYRFIESNGNRAILAKAGMFSVPLVAVTCVAIITTDGLKFRIDGKLNSILSYKMNWDAQRNGTCFLNPEQRADDFKSCRDDFTDKSMLVWGDSHAAQLIPGLERVNGGENGIAQRTASMCPPVIGVDFSDRPYCRSINDYVLHEIKERKPASVILAASWTGYLNKPIVGLLDKTVKTLNSMGVKNVYIIGPVPIWKDELPKLMEINGESSIPMLSRDNVVYHSFATDEKMRSYYSHSTAKYISLIDSMCAQEGCYTVPDDSSSAPMQWDIGHLTEPGSYFISKIIIRSMK